MYSIIDNVYEVGFNVENEHSSHKNSNHIVTKLNIQNITVFPLLAFDITRT